METRWGIGLNTAAGMANSALNSAVTKPLTSRKNQEARLNFAEKHVVWTEEKLIQSSL